MNGITMHKPAFRQQVYRADLNIGELGIKTFQQIVCGAQASDGHWPHGYHFHGDTDIYRTTMTILMLEVYYRYMPSTKV